jgi:single-stranded DNA-binding protein
MTTMTIEFACLASLVRDAEAKTSKAGKQYLRLNVRTGDGDAAQFINATVFDAEAIATVDQLKKGGRVYIEGRLSLDKWTAQDGSERHGLSAAVWHCRLSQIGRNRPRRPASEDRPKAAASGRARAAASDYAPIGADSRPPKGHPAFDDDMPF